ncbi:hypothetical protein V1478_012518 [Vespula squamosa]|uniref:Uncharacterized protein n=1 Tax=Vespula squamosa TaxID=30214 RepID=A0ABD2AE92_VESSQ
MGPLLKLSFIYRLKKVPQIFPGSEETERGPVDVQRELIQEDKSHRITSLFGAEGNYLTSSFLSNFLDTERNDYEEALCFFLARRKL